MQILDFVKLKKENKKLKKELKKIQLENNAIYEKAVIRDKDFCLIPTEMFNELWVVYSNKPVRIKNFNKEAIIYENDTYVLDSSFCQLSR